MACSFGTDVRCRHAARREGLNWGAQPSSLSLSFPLPVQSFAKEPKNPLGRISLDAYFVNQLEGTSTFEFSVNAYPKVRFSLRFPAEDPPADPPADPPPPSLFPLQSLVCRAHSASEMEEWMSTLMQPLQELSKVPGSE
jgi:hypothetical protein